MVTAQVDGSEAPPRVQTCSLCGELFDSLASLDAHLSVTGRQGRCVDPFMVLKSTRHGTNYLFNYQPGTHGRPVWSLALDPTLEDR